MLLLREQQRAVEDDFELSPGPLRELGLDVRTLLANLGRQTGGPWQVVSSHAVRDLEHHVDLPREWVTHAS